MNCRHRGVEVSEVPCKTCKGNVRVKLFDCRLHRYCTEAMPVFPIASGQFRVCGTCPDNTQLAENLLQKRDWVLSSLRTVRNVTTIPRLDILSPELLFRYWSENRPVVFPVECPTLWTDEYLKATCGDATVEVQSGRDGDPNYEINGARHKTMMRFGDYVDYASAADGNDRYMVANNYGVNREALKALWSDVPPIPGIIEDVTQCFFWYGPRGTVTPTHHDLTNNLLVQVRGRKIVRLVAPEWLPRIYNHHHVYSLVDLEKPDVGRFPLFQGVPVLTVEIGPGDALFLPIGWWHHVRALECSISLSWTNFVGRENYFPL